MTEPGPAAGPLRTCSGCRARRPKGELLRFVRDAAGTVIMDPHQQAPGRGGYCCPAEACVQRALRKGSLAHTLRVTIGQEDAAGLAGKAVEYVREQGSAGARTPR